MERSEPFDLVYARKAARRKMEDSSSARPTTPVTWRGNKQREIGLQLRDNVCVCVVLRSEEPVELRTSRHIYKNLNQSWSWFLTLMLIKHLVVQTYRRITSNSQTRTKEIKRDHALYHHDRTRGLAEDESGANSRCHTRDGKSEQAPRNSSKRMTCLLNRYNEKVRLKYSQQADTAFCSPDL